MLNEETTQEPLYGFYSRESVKTGFGSSIYATPNGGEVEVTIVTKDAEGSAYLWADKVYVGVVTHFIRDGIPKTDHFGQKWTHIKSEFWDFGQ